VSPDLRAVFSSRPAPTPWSSGTLSSACCSELSTAKLSLLDPTELDDVLRRYVGGNDAAALKGGCYPMPKKMVPGTRNRRGGQLTL
jgi:hypothetical protein